MLRRLYRPKSFVKLVLVGFALVALLLLVPLITVTIHMHQLVDQSQRAVFHAVQVTQGSRLLVEQLLAMERNVRQFQVLGDYALFDVYATTHEKYQQTATGMLRLPLDPYQAKQLNVLINKEQEIYDTLRRVSRETLESQKAVLEFPALTELAQSLLANRDKLIDRDTQQVQETALKARRVLAWQAFGLIPGALLFAVVFILLIARPVKQIDQAIRQLGDGNFTSATLVSGPRDMEYLGQRLDWLRLRLVELEEEKRKFLRHMSHELKTPLAAIREGAELLAEEVAGPLNEQQHEITAILQQKSRYLQKLIEDLLHFSMAQERQTSGVLGAVPLKRLIEEVAADHRTVIMAKSLALELEADDISVLGDDEKLRIVIDNLLSNAVKFSPDGGRIRIALRRDAETALLDVIDAGPGIDKKDKEKVFEPFYQAPMEYDAPVKGSGIGLSIAREYLIDSHGTIEVIDDIPRGAHFRVTLPVAHKRIERL